jgi:hypothetical protein
MREQAITLHKGIFDCACTIRRGGQEVLPMAFFLVPDGPGSLALIQMPLMMEDKDRAATAIRAAAQKVGAMYVAHVCEAWSVQTQDTDEGTAASAWIQAGNSLETFPGAIDIISVSMDGPGINQSWTVEVKKDGTLGEPSLFDSGCSTGRFTNLSGRVGEN